MASGLHFLGRAWEKRRCGGKFPVYIPEDRRYHKRRDGLGRMPGDGGMRVRLFIGILLPRAVRDSVAESARLPLETVVADALFKLAGELSLEALRKP